MAAITFHANNFTNKSAVSTAFDDDPSLIGHAEGSGIGFFGGGFGVSVPVGSFQDTSFVTNGDGTTSGVKLNNTKWTAISGVQHNSASVTDNTSGIPNWYAPLNVRFTHTEDVAVKNCKLRIFDRSNIENHAVGVTTQVFEVRHPHPIERHDVVNSSGSLNYRAYDDAQGFRWHEFDPEDSMFDVNFTASPGMSGLNTNAGEPMNATSADGYKNYLTKEGAAHRAGRHDWYVALSASPDSIGSKTSYGLYFTLEYF
tara:strand:+ start:26 stop:793 length:768 start_codon:yes stop_codon:yes gene_type:complete